MLLTFDLAVVFDIIVIDCESTFADTNIYNALKIYEIQ